MKLNRLSLPALSGMRAPVVVQAAATVALAAGIGLWGALLLAPRPAPAPPALVAGPAPGQDLTPVSDWFGGGSARLRVAVVGLIASGRHGAALLSINGGPAQAYSVGQTLAPGVTLWAVLPNGVSIDQDGIIEDVSMPSGPLVPHGFVPVAPAGAER